MDPSRIDQLLRQSRRQPPVGHSSPHGPQEVSGELAAAVMARLPRLRFVIPGSFPGRRPLLAAALLGLLAAAGISLLRTSAGRPGSSSEPPPADPVSPPPLSLFHFSPAEPPALPELSPP